MRRDRMQEGKGNVGVAIVIAGLDDDCEFERAAALGACRQSRGGAPSAVTRISRASHDLPRCAAVLVEVRCICGMCSKR
jgi:hypothetical protein